MRFLTLLLLSTMVLTFPARASEFDDAVTQAAGGWQLKMTTPDGIRREPIIIIGRQIDDLVAWYIDGDDPEVCTDVRLEGDVLRLTVKPQEFDKTLTVALEARLAEEDQCLGSAKYHATDGDSGSFEFTGSRIKPSQFNHVEQWTFNFTTPDYERREATVILLSNGNKWYGWYSSSQYELPIRKITHEAGQLVFSLTAKTPEGEDFNVTFRGDTEGKTIRGNAKYELPSESGEFPFSGRAKAI